MVTYTRLVLDSRTNDDDAVEEEPAEKIGAASDLTTKLKYVELNWHVLPTTLPAGISLGRFHPRGLFNLLEYPL